MLDRDTITAALGRLASLLHARDTEGELCLLGGTAMVLAFGARTSTKDVDAIFQPVAVVREMARLVAAELDLPEDWLNDAAKGFTSARHDVTAGDLPQFPGLRVVAPTAEYLLAMKCMASRVSTGPDGPDDVEDIRFLLRRLGIDSVDEALEIVCRYYPSDRVPPRAQFLLEEVVGATTTTKGDP